MTRCFLLVLQEVMAIGKTRNPLDASSDLHIGFHHAMIALSTSQWLAMMTALEDRDADLTACLARERTLGWAAPMEKNATYLDEGQRTSALG